MPQARKLEDMMIIIFLIIVVTVTVGSMMIIQNMLVEAQNENRGALMDIDAIRQESLSNGKIFDHYLIPYVMSPTNIEYFGGIEQANASYNHLNDLLESSKDDKYMKVSNDLTMLSSNFRILADITEPSAKIAALVIQERIQYETYERPELEPLKTLHEYLIAEYPATQTLDDILGNMKILAPEILDIVEKNTLFGNFPSTEIYLENTDYWMTVGQYGDCVFVDEGSDCETCLDQAAKLSLKDKEEKPFKFCF